MKIRQSSTSVRSQYREPETLASSLTPLIFSQPKSNLSKILLAQPVKYTYTYIWNPATSHELPHCSHLALKHILTWCLKYSPSLLLSLPTTVYSQQGSQNNAFKTCQVIAFCWKSIGTSLHLSVSQVPCHDLQRLAWLLWLHLPPTPSTSCSSSDMPSSMPAVDGCVVTHYPMLESNMHLHSHYRCAYLLPHIVKWQGNVSGKAGYLEQQQGWFQFRVLRIVSSVLEFFSFLPIIHLWNSLTSFMSVQMIPTEGLP